MRAIVKSNKTHNFLANEIVGRANSELGSMIINEIWL